MDGIVNEITELDNEKLLDQLDKLIRLFIDERVDHLEKKDKFNFTFHLHLTSMARLIFFHYEKENYKHVLVETSKLLYEMLMHAESMIEGES